MGKCNAKSTSKDCYQAHKETSLSSESNKKLCENVEFTSLRSQEGSNARPAIPKKCCQISVLRTTPILCDVTALKIAYTFHSPPPKPITGKSEEALYAYDYES